MSHPFGDLISHYLHRKHGLSQSKLAMGILQSPSVLTDMCQGKRLQGRQARERVIAIIVWLQQQEALTTRDEANALLTAAGMAGLDEHTRVEADLMAKLDRVTNEHLAGMLSHMLLGCIICRPHSPHLLGDPTRLINWPNIYNAHAC